MCLSKVKPFLKPKVSKEQYMTPVDIASEVLWKAYYNNDIENKVIADLGCGTGIFGIGALLLGARKIIFIDIDEDALNLAKENVSELYISDRSNSDEALEKCEFILTDISMIDNLKQKIDTCITNPPFGTKKKNEDNIFLLKAFDIAKTTYSFHKTITNDYIVNLAKRQGKQLGEQFKFRWMLANTMKYHMKKREYIDVSAYLFRSNGNE